VNVLEQLSGKITHDVEALEAEFQQNRGVAAAQKKLNAAFDFGREKLQEKARLRFSDTQPPADVEDAIALAQNGLTAAQRMAGAAIRPSGAGIARGHGEPCRVHAGDSRRCMRRARTS